MDMKKILQALDSTGTQKPVEGSNEMKSFLQIMEGKGPLNRLTQAESIAVNAHVKKQTEVKAEPKKSIIEKYFKQVELEVAESKTAKVKQLAERAIKNVGGNYGHQSTIKQHIAKSKTPPESVLDSAKQGAKAELKVREEADAIDTVTLDIPLIIRLLEYAREDAKTDMDLHNVTEKLIELSKSVDTLSMDQYDAIVGEQELLPAPEEPEQGN